MSDTEQISLLRNALGSARPFVAGVAELSKGSSYSQRARSVLGIIDVALIQTDPDPIVRKIISDYE